MLNLRKKVFRSRVEAHRLVPANPIGKFGSAVLAYYYKIVLLLVWIILFGLSCCNAYFGICELVLVIFWMKNT